MVYRGGLRFSRRGPPRAAGAGAENTQLYFASDFIWEALALAISSPRPLGLFDG